MRLNLLVTVQRKTDMTSDFRDWVYIFSGVENFPEVFVDVILPWGPGSEIPSGIEGMPIVNWTASETTESVGKETLTGELAFQEYGISDAAISNLFFAKTSSTAQQEGRIVNGTKTYEIVRVEPYPNHWEIIVRPVVS